jgi:hypothetical protein
MMPLKEIQKCVFFFVPNFYKKLDEDLRSNPNDTTEPSSFLEEFFALILSHLQTNPTGFKNLSGLIFGVISTILSF